MASKANLKRIAVTLECTQCKRRFSLGTDAIPPTIEALKAAGCPACGNRHFQRVRNN